MVISTDPPGNAALSSNELLELPLLGPHKGFPAGTGGEEPTCNGGDVGSIPGLGRCPGGGNGNLLQYSCQENSTDRGAWQAIVRGATKSWTRLSD